MKSFEFNLDFRSGVPIYVQIVEQIQQLAVNGTLKPGDQLPTVRQMASELRVNFNTVARAYRLLDENGLISTQQGRGTYLLDRPAETVQEKIKQESLEVQMKRSLSALIKQGFTPEVIRVTFTKLMDHWNNQDLDQEEE